MSSSTHFIRDNVLSRCGQAVTRLAQAGLLRWPAECSSEPEVNEWWLVTEKLAARLRASGQPVVRFGELHMWGRSSTSPRLEDDPDLLRSVVP